MGVCLVCGSFNDRPLGDDYFTFFLHAGHALVLQTLLKAGVNLGALRSPLCGMCCEIFEAFMETRGPLLAAEFACYVLSGGKSQARGKAIARGLARAKEAGYTPGRPRDPSIDRDLIRRLRSEGLSIRGVAAAAGASIGAVQRALNGAVT